MLHGVTRLVVLRGCSILREQNPDVNILHQAKLEVFVQASRVIPRLICDPDSLSMAARSALNSGPMDDYLSCTPKTGSRTPDVDK